MCVCVCAQEAGLSETKCTDGETKSKHKQKAMRLGPRPNPNRDGCVYPLYADDATLDFLNFP